MSTQDVTVDRVRDTGLRQTVHRSLLCDIHRGEYVWTVYHPLGLGMVSRVRGWAATREAALEAAREERGR